jgi:Raf kinase inhibitor-like YbhB/YbcL family protein
VDSGLFDFWLRFGSVAGFSNLLLRRSLAKNSKILTAHRYIISVNALTPAPVRDCEPRNWGLSCGMSVALYFSRFANRNRRICSAALRCAAVVAAFATMGSLLAPPDTHKKMSLSSTAFKDGQAIPVDYTCDGKNISPQLHWTGAPANTQSLALIVDDPDAPTGVWTHWIAFNLSTDTSDLAEDFAKSPDASTIKQGTNDFKKTGYGGPCPPAGKSHRYFFRIFALDTELNLPSGATRKDVDAAMAKHVLAIGQLMGSYQRK